MKTRMRIGPEVEPDRRIALRESGDDVPDETKAAYPALARVLSDRGLGSDEIFDLVCVSILDGIERAVQERRARWLPTPDRDLSTTVGSP